MTKQLNFLAPDGREYKDPDPLWIKELIFNKGADYWSRGAGDATLVFIEGEFQAELILLYCPDKGFYLDYVAKNTQHVLFVEGIEEGSLQVEIGGHRTTIPKNEIVDRTIVWQALRLFLQNGAMNAELGWIDKSFLDHFNSTMDPCPF